MNRFVIGVWAQPAFNINGSVLEDRCKKWADRNVTHIITGDFEPKYPGQSVERYSKWLKDNGGLRWFAYARTGWEDYVKYDNFEGFCMPDEPDMWNHIKKKQDGTLDVDGSVADYLAVCKSLKAKLPNVPIIGNFAGPAFTASPVTVNPKQPVCDAHYKTWFEGLDITSCDWYLANTGRFLTKYLKGTLGAQITKMKRLSGGKHAYACIESSNQALPNSGGRTPSVAEFEAMVVMSVLRGATGIWYFPQKIGGGFAWDATPPELAASMTKINGFLLKNADFFMKGTRAWVDGGVVEVAEWTLGADKLKVVLNCTETAQTYEGKTLAPLQHVWTGGKADPKPEPKPVTLDAVDLKLTSMDQKLEAILKKLGA